MKIAFSIVLIAGIISMIVSAVMLRTLGGFLQWGLVIVGIVGLTIVRSRKRRKEKAS